MAFDSPDLPKTYHASVLNASYSGSEVKYFPMPKDLSPSVRTWLTHKLMTSLKMERGSVGLITAHSFGDPTKASELFRKGILLSEVSSPDFESQPISYLYARDFGDILFEDYAWVSGLVVRAVSQVSIRHYDNPVFRVSSDQLIVLPPQEV